MLAASKAPPSAAAKAANTPISVPSAGSSHAGRRLRGAAAERLRGLAQQRLRVFGRGTLRGRLLGRPHHLRDLVAAHPGPRHHAGPGAIGAAG